MNTVEHRLNKEGDVEKEFYRLLEPLQRVHDGLPVGWVVAYVKNRLPTFTLTLQVSPWEGFDDPDLKGDNLEFEINFINCHLLKVSTDLYDITDLDIGVTADQIQFLFWANSMQGSANHIICEDVSVRKRLIPDSSLDEAWESKETHSIELLTGTQRCLFAEDGGKLT